MKPIYTKLFISTIILISFLIVGVSAYNSGKRPQKRNENKTGIKDSEKQVKTYQKEYDSLQQAYSALEKQKQKVKTIYLQGKESVKYITKERISSYIDTICKKDVLLLKAQLNNSDSLIDVQDKQITTQSLQLTTAEKILQEKDKQMELYKSQKPKIKPLGIGFIGGYGTNLTNGLVPFIGVGVSYNIIRL